MPWRGTCQAPHCTSGCCVPPIYGHWAPPGIGGPWPDDEYICDGGDRQGGVVVGSDFTISNLDTEDTVIHYDTVKGQVVVEPTNRVCIYAPRFASIRRVDSPMAHDQFEQNYNVNVPLPPVQQNDLTIVTTAVQPLAPGRNVGVTQLDVFRERNPGAGYDRTEQIQGYTFDLLPHEGLDFLQRGIVQSHEKARLAAAIDAAIVWSSDQSVQALVDGKRVAIDMGLEKPESADFYDPQGKPDLRICKLASQRDARPGEEITFTLRFDNRGTQKIGNVTIVDNLTPRLEFIPESAECTLPHAFFADENDSGSHILRWELAEPLPAASGGVIRFRCKVR